MKGPALWLKHYLRCREIMTHGEWTMLLALGARHGLWMTRTELMKLPIRCSSTTSTVVRAELAKLESGGLVTVKAIVSPRGRQMTCKARITDKGLALLGWPELTVASSP